MLFSYLFMEKYDLLNKNECKKYKYYHVGLC